MAPTNRIQVIQGIQALKMVISVSRPMHHFSFPSLAISPRWQMNRLDPLADPPALTESDLEVRC